MKLSDVESKYVLFHGYAAEIYESDEGNLCLRYGKNPWDMGRQFTLQFAADGELLNDENGRTGTTYFDLEPLSKELYEHIRAINLAGYQVK